jgi:hypothetical protein
MGIFLSIFNSLGQELSEIDTKQINELSSNVIH